MKLSDIKPNPNNPRLIKDDKFKKLVKSIQDFPEMMDKRPIVCVTDVDGKIFPLGGNMRFKALKEIGYKEIPDTWIQMADEWTEEQRKEFVIKDNVGFGEWDWDSLQEGWGVEQLEEWGLDVPNFIIDENINDIEEIEEFNESVNFTIKCESIEELEQLQTKLNCQSKLLKYNDFLIKAGL
jgi:ParB-like chromosome segregation protein Spo0J